VTAVRQAGNVIWQPPSPRCGGAGLEGRPVTTYRYYAHAAILLRRGPTAGAPYLGISACLRRALTNRASRRPGERDPRTGTETRSPTIVAHQATRRFADGPTSSRTRLPEHRQPPAAFRVRDRREGLNRDPGRAEIGDDSGGSCASSRPGELGGVGHPGSPQKIASVIEPGDAVELASSSNETAGSAGSTQRDEIGPRSGSQQASMTGSSIRRPGRASRGSTHRGGPFLTRLYRDVLRTGQHPARLVVHPLTRARVVPGADAGCPHESVEGVRQVVILGATGSARLHPHPPAMTYAGAGPHHAAAQDPEGHRGLGLRTTLAREPRHLPNVACHEGRVINLGEYADGRRLEAMFGAPLVACGVYHKGATSTTSSARQHDGAGPRPRGRSESTWRRRRRNPPTPESSPRSRRAARAGRTEPVPI
jgi:hypothetical protein